MSGIVTLGSSLFFCYYSNICPLRVDLILCLWSRNLTRENGICKLIRFRLGIWIWRTMVLFDDSGERERSTSPAINLMGIWPNGDIEGKIGVT